MENKYIILTGANGYLGKYVILEALKQNYKIIAFSFDHIRSVKVDHPDVEYIHCDLTKPVGEQNGIREITANKNIIGIINAGALLGSSDINANREVNAVGVQRMMDFGNELGVKRFVQISSVVILKAIKGPYGITKLEGQDILTNSDLDYTVFIPAMILGP